jgi:protein SCO1/2
MSYRIEPKDATTVVHYGKPSLGGPFVLVDHNGNPVTDASYRGKFTLMYFGFSHCPDICPSELVKVGKVLKELGTDSSCSICIAPELGNNQFSVITI